MSSYLLELSNSDIPDLIPLVELAYRDLPYTTSFDSVRVEQFLLNLPHGYMLGLVGSNGVLQGVLLGTVTFLSTSFSPVATELLWYVKPEYRRGKYALQMVREFEKWAKAQGCQMISMGNMANNSMETTGKFYQRLGYKLSEQTYFKDL